MMQKLVAEAVEGKNIFELCVEGDQAIDAGTASIYNKKAKGTTVPKGAIVISKPAGMKKLTTTTGIAFPTCISVNNAVAHFSPLKYAVALFRNMA